MTTPPVKTIHTRAELQELARQLRVRPNWHEPDEQEVTARVFGLSFDNAGFWGQDEVRRVGGMGPYSEGLEMWVTLYQDGYPVAEVNLATLFSWACGTAV